MESLQAIVLEQVTVSLMLPSFDKGIEKLKNNKSIDCIGFILQLS